MKLEIKAGKFYESRDGRVVSIIAELVPGKFSGEHLMKSIGFKTKSTFNWKGESEHTHELDLMREIKVCKCGVCLPTFGHVCKPKLSLVSSLAMPSLIRGMA